MTQRHRSFRSLTKQSRDRVARAGAQYGLTRRQTRERYNRGTYNPLSSNPVKRVPARAPYYPVVMGRSLKDQAIANMDRAFGERLKYNRFNVLDAIENHASEAALRRMANASPDELEHWAEYQRRNSYTTRNGDRQVTPGFVRSLGWSDHGRWRNVFWYH